MSEFIEAIQQSKIIYPGCQIQYSDLTDVNQKYFLYCSTLSVLIFDKFSHKLKCILGSNSSKLIQAVSLDKSLSSNYLCIYRDNEIIIYDILSQNKVSTISFQSIKKIKFNTDSQILILNKQGELFLLNLKKGQTIQQVKLEETCSIFQWFPFNGTDFAFATEKNKIYYSNIENKENKLKYVSIKDSEKFIITEMQFYDIDDNYKNLLVGTSNTKIYLVDLISCEITNSFNRFGKGNIKFLFWLNYQPGSFISIDDKSGKYIKWNVAKNSYTSINKISEYRLTSINKFDNISLYFFSNILGEITLINLKTEQILFEIKNSHYNTIFDIQFNPFYKSGDLYITASGDGTIKLQSINSNTVIHTFNTNKYNNSENQIICVKWSPNSPNLFAAADSQNFLRIFNIEEKKQIMSNNFLSNDMKKEIKKNLGDTKNFIVHGIDWDKENYILLGLNTTIFLFKYFLKENKLNLIKEFDTKNYIYRSIFYDDKIIAPGGDGNIRFYTLIKNESNQINDINNEASKIIKGHNKLIYQISLNKSKNIMASASEDGTIGIYNFSIETENNISKFLTGQSSLIRQVRWIDDNFLVSGSLDGIICLWDVKNLLCLFKTKENKSAIYGLSFCSKYPCLLASTCRDSIIRFWNIKLKNNIFEVFNIKNLSCIDDLQKFIEKNFYYENLDAFFDLLNCDNKEKKLVEKIIKEDEYIYSNCSLKKNNNVLGINNKIDFSITQKEKNILIKKLIKESAIIGSWKLYCELNLLIENWEDALCFAPKVSTSYWENLMNKYEKYINSFEYKNNKKLDSDSYEDDLIFFGLKNQNYKRIIDLCLRKKDFQNALMIWLSYSNNKSNNPNEKENNSDNFLNMEIYHNELLNEFKNNDELLEKLRINLLKDNYLTGIFTKNKYLLLNEGNIINACINFLYLNNVYECVKSLYQSNCVELAYLISNINLENINISNINSAINGNNIKYYLEIILYKNSKEQIPEKVINDFIQKFCDNDDNNLKLFGNRNLPKNSIKNIIENYFKDIIELLCTNFINDNEISEYDKKLYDFEKKLILFKILDLDEENNIEKILSVIVLECLNYNYKSVICLIKEMISKKIIDLRIQKYTNVYSFIFGFIKSIRKNLDKNETVQNYFIEEKNDFIELDLKKYNEFTEKLKFNSFFKCSNSEMKFFYLKEELIPRTLNENTKESSFNKNFKSSNLKKLSSGNFVSQSEYFEMSKYLNIV